MSIADQSKSYDQLSRFGADKRLEEVDRIMQTSRLRVVDLPVPPGVEVNVYRQTMANTLAQRTMATTIGNGAYLYGTKAVDLSRALEVPSIETTVRFASDSFKAPVEDWPRFHNGVAAALAIQGQVDKSWIMHCKPPQLDPEYGGVLLGLGLRRQLGKLRTFDAFSLLESRHEQTTVGLLLGLAAQHIGSKDQTVTKMLSLHTRAFLPMGSVDLNASSNVQASAMLGLGLTHMASGNMRMAKVAKKEISGDDEAYGFSSAMAFGLIMLGRGGDIELRHLYTTIHGPGAILATGLMHLKQGGDYITMPESSAELDTMPPESLLYRVYAQSLIRWDAQPTVEWVHSQVPRFIHDKDVGYMHIIAGACMAIGVKYAGTASESALNTILGFYGNLQRHAASSDTSYEGKIRRRASRQAIDVVTIAMCAVMSGTGEIGVLRRIRIAHGQEGAGINYGTHVALHLALGLLFLGKGYYTLGATDLAVAAMTIAFFPRTGGYLEVFRHLWALAAEPRCLVARDADTGKIENVPLRVTMREPSREQKLMSPTLVSPFEQISEVVVDSVRYWPVQAQDSTIYVQKRSAFLDYSRDNKGTRSIHARVGSLTGFDMHYDLVSPAAPPAIAAAEVIELVYQHTTDTLLHGYARVFAGTGGEFSRAVLLECLVLDKPEAMVPYHILRKDGERGLRQYYKVDFPKLHDDRTLPLIRAPFLAAVASITGVAWPEDEAKRAIASGEDSNLVAMRVYEAVKNYERMTFGKTCRLVDTL
jgi:anaphase-promoting complex subunit 1